MMRGSFGLTKGAGDVPSTFKQFEEAITINPSDPDIYYHR